MARSEEAILRRALKRQRTEEEQRKADRKDMEQSKLRKAREEEKKATRRKDSKGSRSMKGSPFLASTRLHTPTSASYGKPASAPEGAGASSSTNASSSDTPSKDVDRTETPTIPTPSEPDERMREEGAWKCPSCGNENFASRNWCNSKTCNERRPHGIARPPPHPKKLQAPPASREHRQRQLIMEPGAWDCPSCSSKNYASRDKCFNRSCGRPRPGTQNTEPVSKLSSSINKRKRHNPETSKQLVWSKQADAKTLTKNRELRERYRSTNGEGMSQEDIDRAKVLIARDERKRQKKKGKPSSSEASSAMNTSDREEKAPSDADKLDTAIPTTPSEHVANIETKKQQDTKQKSKSQKDKNKALLERFRKTKGKGMKEE